MPVWTVLWLMPASLKNALQHEPVEGDLEAMFDLDLDRGLHVADEDVQGAVRRLLQPQEVHVAPQQPAGEFGLQPGLEQEDGLAGAQLAGFLDDLVVVLGAVVGLAVLDGVVDGGEPLGEVGLDAFLEGVARQGQQRRDPLGDHVVVFHEVLPGTFRQPEAKVAFALLQAHELRYVRGREPHRAVGGRTGSETGGVGMLLLQPVHHRPDIVQRTLVGGSRHALVVGDFGLEVVVVGFFSEPASTRIHADFCTNSRKA